MLDACPDSWPRPRTVFACQFARQGTGGNMYKFITPIQSDWGDLSSNELSALTKVWAERKTILQDDGAYRDFLIKLQREWAIETGIIERLYTWDRGVTEILIEHGIDAALISHKGGLHRNQADH